MKIKKMVYYIIEALEAVLAFRLVFKLFGANQWNPVVSIVYDVSEKLISPFNGIFGAFLYKGAGSKSVLESATIIAIIVYAFIAYGIGSIIDIYASSKNT